MRNACAAFGCLEPILKRHRSDHADRSDPHASNAMTSSSSSTDEPVVSCRVVASDPNERSRARARALLRHAPIGRRYRHAGNVHRPGPCVNPLRVYACTNEPEHVTPAPPPSHTFDPAPLPACLCALVLRLYGDISWTTAACRLRVP